MTLDLERVVGRSSHVSKHAAGADLEHNLGGGQEHARGTGRASGGRCPLLRAKRGSFDFFLVQNAH